MNTNHFKNWLSETCCNILNRGTRELHIERGEDFKVLSDNTSYDLDLQTYGTDGLSGTKERF